MQSETVYPRETSGPESGWLRCSTLSRELAFLALQFKDPRSKQRLSKTGSQALVLRLRNRTAIEATGLPAGGLRHERRSRATLGRGCSVRLPRSFKPFEVADVPFLPVWNGGSSGFLGADNLFHLLIWLVSSIRNLFQSICSCYSKGSLVFGRSKERSAGSGVVRISLGKRDVDEWIN
jgi:hypothetical protein